ncbi:extracellular solute-binding protein [Paenibacillus hamazuiensis]|uniref:extracellular solute-binding protein n=1 Tax=Paenibacillus hamazuiensis TaxID=2936508 RepID=UPI00200C6407|nr:extracellular solute-binding protein [Paenibacillus hamazuiensis]
MSWRKTVSWSLSVAAAVSLAGCGGGGGVSQGDQGVKSGDVKDLASSNEPVTITFYRPNNATTEDEFNKLMGDAIKAKFPNVTPKFIPYDKNVGIDGVITSGNDIDIMLLSIAFLPQFPNYKLQMDHTDLIKKYNFDLNRLEPTMVEYMKNFSSGGMYALPIFTTAETLIYNKDLFDKFGVPYPKDGMTWDETYELAKKMTRVEGGTQYYGLMMSTSHMMRTNQLGLPYVDIKTNTPQIATDSFRRLIENYTRFYMVPGAELKDKKPNELDLFTKSRTLAMYAYFNSAMIAAPEDMNLDAVTLPTFNEAPGTGSQMYPTYAGVVSSSKNKEAAFQILAYLTSEEMQLKFAKDGTGLPVIKNSEKIVAAFGESKPQLKGKNIRAFYPAKPAPIPQRNVYEDLADKQLNAAFTEVILGKSDVNSALRKANEQAAKDIEAAKAAAK